MLGSPGVPQFFKRIKNARIPRCIPGVPQVFPRSCPGVPQDHRRSDSRIPRGSQDPRVPTGEFQKLVPSSIRNLDVVCTIGSSESKCEDHTEQDILGAWCNAHVSMLPYWHLAEFSDVVCSELGLPEDRLI